jgi:hypothetical protein
MSFEFTHFVLVEQQLRLSAAKQRTATKQPIDHRILLPALNGNLRIIPLTSTYFLTTI